MKLDIDQQMNVVTDSATLTLFDPAALKHREKGPDDWFADKAKVGREAAHGRMVLIPTPRDGEYRVRITTHDMTAAERDAVAGQDDSFWIEVTDSRLRLGAAENLPGASDFRRDGAKQTVIIPNGRYRVALFGLNTPHSPPRDLPNLVIRLIADAEPHGPAAPRKPPQLWPKPPKELPKPARARSTGTAAHVVVDAKRPFEFECEMTTEMLGIFDPSELAHAAKLPPEWTMDEETVLAEAKEGHLAFAYGSAVAFRTALVRIQMEPLTISQATHVVAAAPSCWFRVSSGQACCAPSEEWPATTTPRIGPAGRVFTLEHGDYMATFYFLEPEGIKFPIVVELRPLGKAEHPIPTAIVNSLPLGFERKK